MTPLSALRAWRTWLPALTLLALSTQAQALPSFARQTGQDCAACHVGAFGPQLTPYGVKFKLGGYVDGNGKANVPLSGMAVVDTARYKTLNEDTQQYDSQRKSGLTEASVFVAGKLADHLGSFLQVTHSGIEHKTAIDQADLRMATSLDMGEHEAVVGVSVNNNPTVQDPFNTQSVWAFPYTASDRLSYPGADLVSASVEQRVLGVNAYALVNDRYYGELGLYNSISPSMQSRVGVNRYPDDPGVPAARLSNAPYWRVGYTRDLRTQAWHVGLLGFQGTLKDRLDPTSTQRFQDGGLDGGYQFLGNREHVVTVNGSLLREKVQDSSNGDHSTRTFKLATSYHYLNTYGATVAYARTHSSDHDQAAGNSGWTYQVDWTPWGKESSWAAPWANVRLGLQYVRFNTNSDIDTSAGQKVSDLNSVRLFAWTSF